MSSFPIVIGADRARREPAKGSSRASLTLDGPTLAAIFLGNIKSWDDAAIKKLNPGRQAADAADCRRPSLGRFRHDLHLDRLSFQGQPGVEEPRSARTPSVEWPVGIGAKGNEGVANNVTQTQGAIGYVEYAYAKQNKLTTANMMNKEGKVVPDAERSVAGGCGQRRLGSRRRTSVLILTDQSGAASWPIAARHSSCCTSSRTIPRPRPKR